MHFLIYALCVFTPTTSAASLLQTPRYQLVSKKDTSIGAVRRFQIKVALPEHYPRATIEQLATTIVTDVTRTTPVNAISVLFYGPGTSTDGPYDVARVEWAPNGRWEDSTSIRAGEYSSFRYSVSYNAPVPVRVTGLKRSQRRGRLGVPLPYGATLLERKPGDQAAGRDPFERYRIASSAADIAAFFNREMPAAGWSNDASSTESALFFRKGKLMIGVLVNSSGKTFTLMGS